MNYLAHLFLSGKEEEIIIGNLLEDFVVGRIDHERNKRLPERVKVGIQLHRLIDTFTDTHASVSTCKSILYEKYGKYASVIVDIYFDHFLALNWKSFTEESLQDFTQRISLAFIKHWNILPDKMKPLIESMLKYQWLNNYNELSAIEKALLNVSKRAVFDSKMEQAIVELKNNHSLFEENFLIFFPELIQVCQKFLEENEIR